MHEEGTGMSPPHSSGETVGPLRFETTAKQGSLGGQKI